MTRDLEEMYRTRIAMSANLPYPMPIERKVYYDCCGFMGGFFLPRKSTMRKEVTSSEVHG